MTSTKLSKEQIIPQCYIYTNVRGIRNSDYACCLTLSCCYGQNYPDKSHLRDHRCDWPGSWRMWSIPEGKPELKESTVLHPVWKQRPVNAVLSKPSSVSAV